MGFPAKIDTHQKTLILNLDLSTFGSFAEIGAGQEVARWFLIVGGASGTVAKTISAYDKEVSDDLYGSGSRYVSRQRLEAMLENEWTQLLTQLESSRGSHTRFFSFVDTVSARNYAGTNDPHGWIGLRFQLQPGADWYLFPFGGSAQVRRTSPRYERPSAPYRCAFGARRQRAFISRTRALRHDSPRKSLHKCTCALRRRSFAFDSGL